MSEKNASEQNRGNNFLRTMIAKQIESGAHQGQVVTRFPPEPNGFLHIGHARSICVNFGLAEEFNGVCHMRFDDTNPEKEEQQYIDAIQADVKWLGFQWEGPVRFTSDYFNTLYEYAIHLIKNGDAYVDELDAEQVRAYRGDWNTPGKNSPYRDRSVDQNLAAFEKMRVGEFAEGQASLRAKIDMSAGNMNMRDPIIYRVRHKSHHQSGDKWCIYPSYDFAHGQSDAIEKITHSLCTLEFEEHRPLYNWLLEHLPVPSHPVQTEFGRLKLNYTITSKRKLRRLVEQNYVDGWDDPRMPTIGGLRRRGYTPRSIRQFCEMTGVARTDGVVDVAMLEHAIRDDLNKNANRAMCVLDPVKVVITNYPVDGHEWLEAPNHPQDPERGTRQIPFGREIWIEREDFRESANKKFKRLVLGKKVRLRNAYVIYGEDVVYNADGSVKEIHVSYDPDTLGKNPADGKKPKGVIHWVSKADAVAATVRLYDRLFTVENPAGVDGDFVDYVNPDALIEKQDCWLEPAAAEVPPETHFQFERVGYFVADRKDHAPQKPVFNRTVSLRDSRPKKVAE